MNRTFILSIFFGTLTHSLIAEDSKKTELAKQPMYERILKEEDAKKAAELVERIGKHENAKEWDAAKKLAQVLIDMRVEKQGADHYEVTDARQRLLKVEIQAQLSPEDWQQLSQTNEKHRQFVVLFRGGEISKAAQLGEQILITCKKLLGENHSDTTTIMNNLALLYLSMGETAKAELIYLQTRESYKKILGEYHPNYARSLINLGGLYYAMGEYCKAEPFFLQARDFLIKSLGENHSDFAQVLNNLGQLYETKGEYSKAEPHLQKARDIWKKVLGESHPYYATSLNNLALLYTSMGEPAKAEPLYLQAGDVYKRLLGENHPYYATSLSNLASLYKSMGELAKSEPLYLKSKDLRKKLLGENHPDYATGLNNLASYYASVGELAKAEQLYLQARDLYKKILGENHINYTSSLNNLGLLYFSMGAHVKAEQTLRECTRSYEMSRLIRATGFQRAIGNEGDSPFDSLAVISARLGMDQTAYEALERDLARAYLDVQVSRRGQTMTVAQQALQSRIREALSPIDKSILVLLNRTKLTVEESRDLDLQIKKRQNLNVELAELAAELSTQEVSNFAEIQTAIPHGNAMLLWVDVQTNFGALQEHWACVLKASGEPLWVPLPGTGPDGKWTKEDSLLPSQLRRELAAEEPSQTTIESLAKKLYAQRIAPVLKHLNGVKTLYVVGVNEMAGIPVSVLTDQFTISYVPSGTFLARLKDLPKSTGTRVLALGDAIYSDPNAARRKNEDELLRGKGWKDLPGTRVETNRLKQLFGENAQVFTDGNASERTLESLRKSGELSKYRYLHFAAHGEGNSVQAFESALILSQDKLSKEPILKAGEPFLNGQLSAREVLDYWKLNAELVTLSACETAFGKSGGGDGMLGFAQAFLTAGARSVCLSLWQVDDIATALLMSRFYENLLGKREGLSIPMGKAAALDEAKRWLRELTKVQADKLYAQVSKDVDRRSRAAGVKVKELPKVEKNEKPFAHPKYWAAFILIGDPD